jgi:hypothetical protein
MAQWMRLQLGNGSVEGRRLVAADSLERTRLPHSVARPAQAPGGRTDFYGLGWNVGYDDHGRLRLGHSGAFALGAATAVAMLPSEQLGIVVLTNGEPVGAPEAVANTFLDIAQDGQPSIDWLGFAGRIFAAQQQSERSRIDYAKPPANAAPARPAAAYVGSYANDYYGPLTITRAETGLVMQLGPRHLSFPLTHYDRGETNQGHRREPQRHRAGNVHPALTSETTSRSGLPRQRLETGRLRASEIGCGGSLE